MGFYKHLKYIKIKSIQHKNGYIVSDHAKNIILVYFMNIGNTISL